MMAGDESEDFGEDRRIREFVEAHPHCYFMECLICGEESLCPDGNFAALTVLAHLEQHSDKRGRNPPRFTKRQANATKVVQRGCENYWVAPRWGDVAMTTPFEEAIRSGYINDPRKAHSHGGGTRADH